MHTHGNFTETKNRDTNMHLIKPLQPRGKYTYLPV